MKRIVILFFGRFTVIILSVCASRSRIIVIGHHDRNGEIGARTGDAKRGMLGNLPERERERPREDAPK